MRTAPPLVGREAELASLEAFLRHLAEGSRCLLLEGEMGIGKTTLLRWLTAEAARQSCRVLSTSAIEAELPWEFSALADLFEDVPPQTVERLPAVQRSAVGIAVYRDEPAMEPVDGLTLATAVLTVFRELASDSPLLVAIDDLPLIDRSSARVLEFVLHRAGSAPIGLIGTVRTEWQANAGPLLTDSFERDLLERLSLGPLSIDALADILGLGKGGSSENARLLRIHEWSRGNPLFALHLLNATPADLAEASRTVRVPEMLQRLVRSRLSSSSVDGREVLLVAALATTPSIAAVMAASTSPVTARLALEEAERLGLVSVSEGDIIFSHPLIRAVTVSEADPAERRKAHLRLAEATRAPEERARYLALGSGGPDEAVASEVESAASTAAARGGSEIAAALAALSIDLTPVELRESRHRRMVLEADCRFLSADPYRASALLESVVEEMNPSPERAELLRRLARYAMHRGDGATAWAERLWVALEEAGDEPAQRSAIALDLAVALSNAGEQDRAAEYGMMALAAATDAGDAVREAQICAGLAYGVFMQGGGIVEEFVERALAGPPQQADLPMELRPRYVIGRILMLAEQFERARELLEAELAGARDEGIKPGLALLLGGLAELESWTGNWVLADELLDEMMDAGEKTPIVSVLQGVRGCLQLYRGKFEDGLRAVQESIASARAANLPLFVLWGAHGLGLAHLSSGDGEEAHAQLAPMVEFARLSGITEPSLLRFVPDEIEALVRIGELDAAGELLDYFEECVRPFGRPWSLATTCRVRALLLAAQGDLSASYSAVESALAEHQRIAQPFEEARTLLVAGEIYRRGRAKRKAADAFADAASVFDALGTPFWARRAREELGRVGLRSGPSADDRSGLTAVEREVVELVVAGLANRQIAGRLFMSQRTVESHLSHVYRKLGVRSRTQLSSLYAQGLPERSSTD